MRPWRRGRPARRRAALGVVLACIGLARDGSATGKAVTVSIHPVVVVAGSALRLRCVVPKHPDNRGLEYGVEGYTASGRDLAGAGAAVFQPEPAGHVIIPDVPCGVGRAYCLLRRVGGKTDLDATAILVSGCD